MIIRINKISKPVRCPYLIIGPYAHRSEKLAAALLEMFRRTSIVITSTSAIGVSGEAVVIEVWGGIEDVDWGFVAQRVYSAIETNWVGVVYQSPMEEA